MLQTIGKVHSGRALSFSKLFWSISLVLSLFAGFAFIGGKPGVMYATTEPGVKHVAAQPVEPVLSVQSFQLVQAVQPSEVVRAVQPSEVVQTVPLLERVWLSTKPKRMPSVPRRK